MKTSDNFDMEVNSQNTVSAIITQSLIDGFFQKMNWKKVDQSLDNVNYPDFEQYSSSTDSPQRSNKRSSLVGHGHLPSFAHTKSSF